MLQFDSTTASTDLVDSEYTFADRRQVRIHCRIHIHFQYGDVADYGYCWNLGAYGMYVAYEGEVKKGDPIEISFFLSEEYPSLIDLSAKIIWTNSCSARPFTDMPPGFGVEFIQLTNASRAVIQKFIQSF